MSVDPSPDPCRSDGSVMQFATCYKCCGFMKAPRALPAVVCLTEPRSSPDDRVMLNRMFFDFYWMNGNLMTHWQENKTYCADVGSERGGISGLFPLTWCSWLTLQRDGWLLTVCRLAATDVTVNIFVEMLYNTNIVHFSTQKGELTCRTSSCDADVSICRHLHLCWYCALNSTKSCLILLVSVLLVWMCPVSSPECVDMFMWSPAYSDMFPTSTVDGVWLFSNYTKHQAAVQRHATVGDKKFNKDNE